MSDLEFTGGFDISEALQSVDDFGSNATATLEEVAASFATALADAGATALAEIAGGSAEIPITADIAPAESEVAGLVATTDAETATISVEADVSGADAAVADLGDSIDSTGVSASGAGTKVEGFGESTALVAGSAALARGEVGGLGEVASGAGLASAGAVTGVAALGASVFELAQKGIEATSAEQRFNTIIGETAAAVEKVQVGSLTADLGELGLKFGSTDAQMKNSASSLFQFALNSGASRDAAARFTDEVVALSARAESLNPQLGNLGDIAESLGVKIARGGRFAASYGIALTAAEINTRALSDTQKTSASDLTIYEKATAATELAVAKYGNTLGTTVAEGAKNAANEQKSLKAQLNELLEQIGKPLVAPLFDTIRAAIPSVVALAVPLAELATAVLPPLAAVLQLVGPLIGPLAEGFVLFEVATKALPFVLNLVTGSLLTVAESSAVAGTAVGVAATDAATASAAFAGVAGPLGLIAGGVLIADQQFGLFATDVESATDQAKGFTDALRKTTDAGLVSRFSHDIGEATARALAAGDSFTKAGIGLDTFRRIADEDVGVARRLLSALNDAGANTDGYAQVLHRATVKQQESKKAEEDSAASKAALLGPTDQLTSATGDQTSAVKTYVQALDDEKKALDEIQNRLLGLPGAQLNEAQAVRDQAQAQKDYNDALASGDPDKIAQASLRLDGANQSLARSTLALQQAQSDFNDILKESPEHIQAEIDRLKDAQGAGPEAAAALQPYIDQLQAIHDKAAALQGLEATITVRTQIIGAGLPDIAGMQAFIDSQSGLAGLQPLVDFLGALGQRASGGPVQAGMPYLVNEQTPNSEIFVPDQSGTIYTQGQWAAASGGGGGGGGDTFYMTLQQASTNPTREALAAARQARRGVAMVALG